MTGIEEKIAAGLERAFADQGFAVPSVEDLRDAAGVSLRTLYKYAPSRGEMVRIALEHRHRRYMAHLFDDLQPSEAALFELLDRIGVWMVEEASHGCLFHAAVAAAPQDRQLRHFLEGHKAEVSARAAKLAGLEGAEVDLALIIEGLTQGWPLHGARAVDAAKRLAGGLRAAEQCAARE
ncbi:TetR family transcriptional regulator [Sulfitobacter sp. D35]|uniref:TetR/AcrR family transcriptional regulator n=1 Tax=Sulfitobacter sp. D35 TaxID=3083252 RepID=UPI00296ED029|nr:TetR family transcriptional regulator [Sulfitobacter sp. D35]MDW4497088.1 TetR family transcriptional regulator [Sulfitobacter sp. D35]